MCSRWRSRPFVAARCGAIRPGPPTVMTAKPLCQSPPSSRAVRRRDRPHAGRSEDGDRRPTSARASKPSRTRGVAQDPPGIRVGEGRPDAAKEPSSRSRGGRRLPLHGFRRTTRAARRRRSRPEVIGRRRWRGCRPGTVGGDGGSDGCAPRSGMAGFGGQVSASRRAGAGAPAGRATNASARRAGVNALRCGPAAGEEAHVGRSATPARRRPSEGTEARLRQARPRVASARARRRRSAALPGRVGRRRWSANLASPAP